MAEKKKVKKTKQNTQPAQQYVSAAKRIENLEKAIMSVDKNMNMVVDEVNRLSNVLQGLAVRMKAIISAGEQGTITNSSVNDIIVQENVLQLKNKIDELVKFQVLTPDAEAIGEKTFVVGRELQEQEGVTKETNPRVQFSFDSLKDPEMKSKLENKKVGDLISFEEGGSMMFEVTEIYSVNDPKESEVNFEETSKQTSEEKTEEPVEFHDAEF